MLVFADDMVEKREMKEMIKCLNKKEGINAGCR